MSSKKLGRPFNIKTKWNKDNIKKVYIKTKTNEKKKR